MSFGENLKKRRKELHLTQGMLAELVGTTKQTIQKYESGIILTPPMSRVETLALVLSTSPAALLGWEEELPYGVTHAVGGDLGEPGLGQDALVMNVTDDSMAADGLLRGGKVWVTPARWIQNGAIHAIQWRGELLLRRLYNYPDKTALLLLAGGREAPPVLLVGKEREEVRLLGTVTRYSNTVE